ncbi:MAG: hypothetical protein RR224_02395 [Clostridia bacterium]
MLTEYLNQLRNKIDLPKKEIQAIVDDFEAIFTFYLQRGLTVQQAMLRLGEDPLGDFYQSPSPDEWYRLDNAAKVYPLSMTHTAIKMYRVSAYLKEPVIPCVLQVALLTTLRRFPRFSTTIKRGVFWHYLDAARVHYTVRQEHMMPCTPIDVCRNHSLTFRVQYFNQRISFEAFHVLSDGTGALIFLKTLVAQYLKLLGISVPPNPEIFDLTEVPTEQEWRNDFTIVDQTKAKKDLSEKLALQVRGRRTTLQPARITHYFFSVKELLQIARSHETTITVLVLRTMLLSAKATIHRKRGRINIDVPVNMRKFYASSTLNNFSMYGVLSFRMAEITEDDTMLTRITEKLAIQTSKDAMDKKVSWINSFVNQPLIRFLPLYIKSLISRISFKLFGEKTVTATLSNLGVVKCDFAGNVEQFDFILGPTSINIVGCAMGSYEDHMTFTITSSIKEPSFEQAMLEQFQKLGLAIRVEEVNV